MNCAVGEWSGGSLESGSRHSPVSTDRSKFEPVIQQQCSYCFNLVGEHIIIIIIIIFIFIFIVWVEISSSLSPRHGASSGCACSRRPPDLDGEGVAVNVLNKQLRTASKGWSLSFRVGLGANNPSPLTCYSGWSRWNNLRDRQLTCYLITLISIPKTVCDGVNQIHVV
jgi:hypothetical protein